MKKLFLAPFALAALFALSGATRTTPAASAETIAPDFGGCRYFCGSKPNIFTTRISCERVCTQGCEEVC